VRMKEEDGLISPQVALFLAPRGPHRTHQSDLGEKSGIGASREEERDGVAPFLLLRGRRHRRCTFFFVLSPRSLELEVILLLPLLLSLSRRFSRSQASRCRSPLGSKSEGETIAGARERWKRGRVTPSRRGRATKENKNDDNGEKTTPKTKTPTPPFIPAPSSAKHPRSAPPPRLHDRSSRRRRQTSAKQP